MLKNPMAPKYAIEMEDVAKNYGGRPVLDGVRLCVEKGKTVSLFGENGSGKTSLLKIAAALAKPDRGKVAVAGFETASRPEKVREKVGFVSHEDCLYESLSPFDNLRFFCKLQRVGDSADRARELIKNFEIVPAFAPSGELSAGMKKRISIARAVSHNPEVVLLDEPFSGLDRRGTAILSELLEHLKQKGKTVLMATHLIEDGVLLSDFAAFLKGGQIAFYKSTSEMAPEAVEAEFDKLSPRVV